MENVCIGFIPKSFFNFYEIGCKPDKWKLFLSKAKEKLADQNPFLMVSAI